MHPHAYLTVRKCLRGHRVVHLECTLAVDRVARQPSQVLTPAFVYVSGGGGRYVARLRQGIAREHARDFVPREGELFVSPPASHRHQTIDRGPLADLQPASTQEILGGGFLSRGSHPVAQRVRLERLDPQLRDGTVEEVIVRRFGFRGSVYGVADAVPRGVTLRVRRGLLGEIPGEGFVFELGSRRESAFTAAPEPRHVPARQHVRRVAPHQRHAHVGIVRGGLGRFVQLRFFVLVEDARGQLCNVQRRQPVVAAVRDGERERATPRTRRESSSRDALVLVRDETRRVRVARGDARVVRRGHGDWSMNG